MTMNPHAELGIIVCITMYMKTVIDSYDMYYSIYTRNRYEKVDEVIVRIGIV